MTRNFRVVDCRLDMIESLQTVTQARTPEEAAQLALGERLVRGGPSRQLRARVYFQHEGGPISMVRLYSGPVAP